ncbi:uncharacterized protein At5g19025-like isoform X2 [Salvia miltiorrhiza]|uniref:uncharacterized protein At5g19025-like isoform X2 n=1 Tax=Salvia miltiorrhiza TaxID=226208 RepID=UPI0025ABBB44|nr:uncharacterized protein At5g19025-like isoform X2 [Salvia miltiorrhiza]
MFFILIKKGSIKIPQKQFCCINQNQFLSPADVVLQSTSGRSTLTCASPRPHANLRASHFAPPEIPSPPPSTIMRSSTTTITMRRSAPNALSPQPSISPNCPSLCRHSPSATLDLLILLLVLFSGAFLITSYFSYLFHSLSLLLPPLASDPQSQLIFLALFAASFLAFVSFFEICCGGRSRRCGRAGCRGLKRGMEFDLLLQGEELLRVGDGSKAVRDVNSLPWKGGGDDNPDYECLRAELRKMAPPNGRAVLLFCLRCGCPISKLEGWGPKRGRRHKKSWIQTILC